MLTLMASLVHLASPAPTACGLFTLTVDSLAPGVYVAYQREPFPSMLYLEGNSTIIVNADDAIVIDAGANPAVGRCLVRIVKSLTPKPVRYLINTHWHGDHTLGNTAFVDAFPGIEIIGSHATATGVLDDLVKNTADLAHDLTSRRAQGAAFMAAAQNEPEPARDSLLAMLHKYYDRDLAQRQRDYANARVAAPTLLVDDSLTIRRGEREIRVFSIGKGDAPGTLVVYLPRERILASADLVAAPIPFGFTKEQQGWRATLGRIDSLPYSILVPGHGDIQRDHGYVRGLMALVDSTQAQTRRLLEPGWPADSVLAHIDEDALGAPFVRGSPTLEFYFEQYFLIPFVMQSVADAQGSHGRH